MNNSIFNTYALPSHSGIEASPRSGAAGTDGEVEPAQVVVEVLCGNAAVATEERLDLLMTAVNGLNVHVAANPFAG